MDADLNYMRDAIQCYEKHGFKVCCEKFPKVSHRTTISRYRKCVQAGHRSNSKVAFEKTRGELVKRIVAEERQIGAGKIGMKRARELFHEVKAEPGMTLSHKVCTDALKRARECSKMVKLLGNEEMDDGRNNTNEDWIHFDIQWPKLLLLGDSLTQVCFPGKLLL